MNKNQRTVILVALSILLGGGIFIPYDGTQMKSVNEKPKIFIGYFTVFIPPSRRDMAKSFIKSDFNPAISGHNIDDFLNAEYSKYYTYKPSISLLKLMTEIFILLILTIGLLLYFSGKVKTGENKKGWWDRFKAWAEINK